MGLHIQCSGHSLFRQDHIKTFQSQALCVCVFCGIASGFFLVIQCKQGSFGFAGDGDIRWISKEKEFLVFYSGIFDWRIGQMANGIVFYNGGDLLEVWYFAS
jgi:hypothetical protein